MEISLHSLDVWRAIFIYLERVGSFRQGSSLFEKFGPA